MSRQDTQFKQGNVPWNKGKQLSKDQSGGRKRIKFNINKVKKLYLAGQSTIQLEKQFGISSNTIARRLDQIGVNRRSRSEVCSLVMNRPEVKRKFDLKRKVRWNKPEEHLKMSQFQRELNRNKSWKINRIKNSRKAQSHKKTKPEKIIEPFLKQFGFEYAGDGKFFIESFNPDFVNKERKIIIEVFGDYWHNLPRYKKADKRRLLVYSEAGYKTIVFWESEIIGANNLSEKI
jgi:G:T-mismatch repair DNA endonuclease (very short patch repair protein)